MGTFVSSRQVGMNINLMTPWWLSGASIDLDFDNGRYYDSSLGASAPLAPLNSYLSISRASTGYAQDSSGAWIAFGNDTLRITNKGLLIEDARTNYLLNSGSPATQTTASLSTGSYTLWVEGSGSATPSAGSATITGAGPATAGTPDTFTVTVAGTVTVTVSGSLTRFQLEAGAFASSYIPTAGASATRAADNVTVSGGLDTVLSGSAASTVVDFTLSSVANDASMLGTLPAQPPIMVTNAGFNSLVSSPAGTLSATIGNSIVLPSPVKAGLAWSAAGRSIVAGAGTVATDATNIVGARTSGVKLFAAGSGYSSFGICRRLTVWNSKLADATLQGLTAP